MNLIKRYDKLLFVKKHLDGTKEVLRKSPYKNVNYSILLVRNRIAGSYRHILKDLYEQDAQKTNIIAQRAKQNQNIGSKTKRVNKQMHKELAQFISNNQKI